MVRFPADPKASRPALLPTHPTSWSSCSTGRSFPGDKAADTWRWWLNAVLQKDRSYTFTPCMSQGKHTNNFCLISTCFGSLYVQFFISKRHPCAKLIAGFPVMCCVQQKNDPHPHLSTSNTKIRTVQKDRRLFLITMEDRPIRWSSSVLVRCDMTNSRTQLQCPII